MGKQFVVSKIYFFDYFCYLFYTNNSNHLFTDIYERTRNYNITGSCQYLYDLCLVRTSQATGDGKNCQHSAFSGNSWKLVYRIFRVFFTNSGKQNRLYWQWWNIFSGSAENHSGGDNLAGILSFLIHSI